MSIELLERRAASETLSDTEWKPRDAQRQAFDRSAKAPTLLSSRPWVIRLTQGMLQIADPPPTKLKAIIQKVANLCNLKPNWDSYGAKPIDPDNAVAAILFLLNFLDDNSPLPVVIPLNRGGVQFEWHSNGIDLEIAVLSPSRFHVSFEDIHSKESAEDMMIIGNLQPIQRFLEKLWRVN